VIRPITGWPWAKAEQAAKAMLDSSQRRAEWVMVVSREKFGSGDGRTGRRLYVKQRNDYSGADLTKSSGFIYGKP
jgi:hypothetical protein